MTEQFIKKAKLIHGDKYDYSKVDYKNMNTKVIIICKEHEVFEQIPKNHLHGAGCPKCGIISRTNKRKTPIKKFIEKCKEKYGDKYDYFKVNYINSNIKVIIICKEHGEFEQTPYCHLITNGCCKCLGNYKLTTEEFIEKAKLMHQNKYDYSKVDYKKYHTKVIIICKIHGEFEQTPHYHLITNGCCKCSGIAKSNTIEFIEKANLIHNNKYDYSKVDYKNCSLKVIIICKIHGEFEQRPNCHLKGQGCFKCSGIAKSNTT